MVTVRAFACQRQRLIKKSPAFLDLQSSGRTKCGPNPVMPSGHLMEIKILRNVMADPLYLSLWYPNFDVEEMLPHMLSVLRQFPFSAREPGVSYVAQHPVSWGEATILERRFSPGASPEAAVLVASELLHEDYAYVFEGAWDLWVPGEDRKWQHQPSRVKFIARALDFDEGAWEQEGHIQVDFGLDSSLLQEGVSLTAEAEEHVRSNVHQLVEFTTKIEKKSGASGRLLWSESEENFAQKLI